MESLNLLNDHSADIDKKISDITKISEKSKNDFHILQDRKNNI